VTPRSKVAVLFTKPETVREDYARLMQLAGMKEALPVGPEVSLRINISWHVYMPACSTTPWQLESVIESLLADGHARERIYAAQNRTVVVDCRVGAVNNNLQPVLDRQGIEIQYLNEKPTQWLKYEPKAKMRVLNARQRKKRRCNCQQPRLRSNLWLRQHQAHRALRSSAQQVNSLRCLMVVSLT